jgi:L-alanine-DL-glutamate epimerase-like enolase superfamily enzyme
VHACTIPTDEPESDGTAEWDSTTIVIAEVDEGIGYTYCDAAAAEVIREQLADLVHEDVRKAWLDMQHAVRNMGRPGIAACAISAVDQALWDRKARRLGVPLADLLGAAHDHVPVYGSGGFCTYSLERLQEQLGGWASQGIPRVKMKLGREPDEDPQRLDAVREAIGDDTELFVDANGAFTAKVAVMCCEWFWEFL